MPEKIPSLDEFKASCRAEFSYLVHEFGFTEEPLPQGRHLASHCIELPNGKFINGFAVWFWNGSLRIIVEGVNWGLHADMAFETADGQRVGFGHVVAQFRGSMPKLPAINGGQLQDIERMALMLRNLCEPLLRGNPTALAEALRIQQVATARLRRDLELLPYKRDAASAEEAFRRKDYSRAIQLLSPHIGRLSPTEERRLEFARKHIG